MASQDLECVEPFLLLSLASTGGALSLSWRASLLASWEIMQRLSLSATSRGLGSKVSSFNGYQETFVHDLYSGFSQIVSTNKSKFF